MAIQDLTTDITARIGTFSEFGGVQIIESIMTGKTNDGRDVQIFRAAFGHPYFEIKIDGVAPSMRINLMDTIEGLIDQMAEMHPAPSEPSKAEHAG